MRYVEQGCRENFYASYALHTDANGSGTTFCLPLSTLFYLRPHRDEEHSISTAVFIL